LVSSATSDLELQLALAIGASALIVALGIVAQVLAMRVRNLQRARDVAAAQTTWRPLLAKAALGELPELPALRGRAERADVLLLWNQMQDGIRGSAHDGLNRLADRLDFHATASKWIARGSLSNRVLGLATLGHLGRDEDVPALQAALHDPQALVSIAAARALLQVDAAAAAPMVLDEYLGRGDWPAARVGTLLRDAGADAVAPALMDRLLSATGDAQLRLLRLLRFAESPRMGSVLQQLVERSDDAQVLSVALRQLHGPDALARVRELAQHADALVRSAAAVALGNMGTLADRPLLTALMADRDWWVRYRAAQAVVALPGSDRVSLAALRAGLRDRFARDMLDHVCAEMSISLDDAPPLQDLLAFPLPTPMAEVPR